MDASGPVADLIAFLIQEIGALLFGLVFLFLYRQSKVVYFGLWSIAWVLRSLAALLSQGVIFQRHAPPSLGPIRATDSGVKRAGSPS